MSKKPLLGSHQRSWVWGRNVVVETLRAGIWVPYELRLTADAERELRELAGARDVAVHVEPAARLTQLCGAADHQGVIAKMPPFPYAEVAEVLRAEDARHHAPHPRPLSPRRGELDWGAAGSARGSAGASPSRSVPPFFVITDHVQDPYNFGAIVRSAEGFGAAGVFIPGERQVGVTSQVARSSAGAVNHVPIARVEDLMSLADELKRRGVRLVAASEHAAASVGEADLSRPVAAVIGNEGVGIDEQLLAKCDVAVAIPLAGRVGSLNAAVAAGILMYEVARQRDAPAANHEGAKDTKGDTKK